MGGLATILPLVFVLWQNSHPHQNKDHIFNLLSFRRKKVAPMVGWAIILPLPFLALVDPHFPTPKLKNPFSKKKRFRRKKAAPMVGWAPELV